MRSFLYLDDFKTYKVIKDLMNITRLAIFNPSPDGKLRCSWNMFGTETGRCSPSSSQNIFGGSKWQRAFIKPSWGSCLVYLDYEQQELAIAGYLSGDKKINRSIQFRLRLFTNGEVVRYGSLNMQQKKPTLKKEIRLRFYSLH